MNLEEKDILRDVTLEGTGFRLVTWDPQRSQVKTDKHPVGYALFAPGESEALFQGEDYRVSHFNSLDSDECLRRILGFLTLGKDDTDEKYFMKYTSRQLAFRDGPHRKELNLLIQDDSHGRESMAFVDTDSCTYPRAC